MSKQKIAILGGGVGAITTAFELTNPAYNPHWQDDYEVTIYQMGWRLGGKGASGRNMDPAYAYRIEEHGLHIWSGIYENAFRLIRQCYDEAGRPPDAPLATWQDAFKPANFVVLQEQYKGEWYNWPLHQLANDEVPGEPDAHTLLPLWTYLSTGLKLLRNMHRETRRKKHRTGIDPQGWFIRLLQRITGVLQMLLPDLGTIILGIAQVISFFLRPEKSLFGKLLAPFTRILVFLIQKSVLGLMYLFVRHRWKKAQPRLNDTDKRHQWITLNFAYAHFRGILRDHLIHRGVDAIDDLDYREWLARHVYPDTVDGDSLTMSAPLAWNETVANFAYINGDLQQPNLAASGALYFLCRVLFTSKGAAFWKMQAGMGDAVFSPLYEVLKQRGVQFKFFHRVQQLHLSKDQQRIEAITIGRQVRLKKGHETYDPLVNIKGLPCWPSTPLYEQLEDGDRLQDEQINFEDWQTPVIDTITLRKGTDFDQVVLGISIGAFPYICEELIRADARWKAMVDHVQTVQTQAFQLWLKPTVMEMGWPYEGRPIVSDIDDTPLSTWADMTHLLHREGWPSESDEFPQHIAYFCGALQDEPSFQQTDVGPKHVGTPPSQRASDGQVKERATALLYQQVQRLLPEAITPEGHLNWDLLIDNRDGAEPGASRLDAQYFRANIQPSERYVLSVAGSGKYRLAPNDSGFDNLVLTGDWTKNGFDVGCVEATVMSAMLAATAISGYPGNDKVVGYTFGHAHSRLNKKVRRHVD